MTKLTTERLEELANATTPSVKYVGREIIAMARQLLAYEQAAKNPVGEFYHEKQGGWYQISEGDKVSDSRRIPLYAAPVLPKQPEHSRQHFESLCNQFWNWAELDGIDQDEEPRLEWNGSNYTHRVTAALWKMYQAAPAQPVIPEQRQIVPDEIMPDQDNTFDYVDGWNACRSEMLKAQQNEPQNIPENIPAPLDAKDLELYIDMLENSDSDDEDGELNNTQLIMWLKELQRRRTLPAQPVSEPYKFPQGWMKGQFAYQDLFNAIGAAVVSKHPSIEISVKAFEDSMLAAVPTQDDKSASTELPNHSNLSTNSPVIPDGSADTKRLNWLDDQNARLNEYYGTAYGWKFDANFQRNAMMLNDCNFPVMTVRQAIDEAMLAAAPAQESE